MPRTMGYQREQLTEPAVPNAKIRACIHERVWIVDLASGRVVRGVCDVCATETRPVLDADRTCAGRAWDGSVAELRHKVVVDRRS